MASDEFMTGQVSGRASVAVVIAADKATTEANRYHQGAYPWLVSAAADRLPAYIAAIEAVQFEVECLEDSGKGYTGTDRFNDGVLYALASLRRALAVLAPSTEETK